MSGWNPTLYIDGWKPPVTTIDSEEHLNRVRRICLSLPGATEKLSHGEPAFFAGKVFAMFSNNHHNDGRVAVTVPAPPGVQAALLLAWPDIYYYPPYAGCRGWLGIRGGLAHGRPEETSKRTHARAMTNSLPFASSSRLR